jgi:hypothetical protein
MWRYLIFWACAANLIALALVSPDSLAKSLSICHVARKSRDDFAERTKLQIAKRAGWLCSFPTCRASTVDTTSEGESEINIGTAAHICAAAPRGPRYVARGAFFREKPHLDVPRSWQGHRL